MPSRREQFAKRHKESKRDYSGLVWFLAVPQAAYTRKEVELVMNDWPDPVEIVDTALRRGVLTPYRKPNGKQNYFARHQVAQLASSRVGGDWPGFAWSLLTSRVDTIALPTPWLYEMIRSFVGEHRRWSLYLNLSNDGIPALGRDINPCYPPPWSTARKLRRERTCAFGGCELGGSGAPRCDIVLCPKLAVERMIHGISDPPTNEAVVNVTIGSMSIEFAEIMVPSFAPYHVEVRSAAEVFGRAANYASVIPAEKIASAAEAVEDAARRKVAVPMSWVSAAAVDELASRLQIGVGQVLEGALRVAATD